jgi:hypothetical protein
MKGKLVRSTKKVFKKHGSTILTCVGAGGVIGTTVLAVKATPKAMLLIEEAEELKGEKLTVTETVQVAWKPYVPAAVTGAATIACIFGANALNKKQQASLMSAYALLDQKYQDYKNKVADIYGEEADKEIEEEIAKDKYAEYEHNGPLDNGEILYYDEFSHRYFMASPEKVKDAEYEFNKLFAVLGEATVNEYYELLGISKVMGGDEFGWSQAAGAAWYGYSWIEFSQEKVTMEDGLEAIIITMPFEPTVDYQDY